MTVSSHQHALAARTALMEYELIGLLGAGAFGITYLARDTLLDKEVAIKEYLPSAFAARSPDGTVVPITHQQAQDYRWGLERFSLEARTLGKFSHPNIVHVNRYFEANGTGYMVMDYVRGQSLKALVKAQPLPSEQSIRAIVGPLLDGLEKVHAAGFLHRDIKPDNIFVREDGRPVLIDFGSARQTLGDSAAALTTIVSPGYAPFEQYTTSKRQGPWSDIYSMGGVLYFLVKGESPPDAITRMKGDDLTERLSAAGARYSPALIDAIEWSMALEETERPQDVLTWRAALLGSPLPEVSIAPSLDRTVRVEPHVPTTILRSEILAGGAEPGIASLDSAGGRAVGLAKRLPRAQRWERVFKYLVMISAVSTLGLLFGKLEAFQGAQVMDGRISAATLAQLISAAGTLAFLWLLARALASRFSVEGSPRAVLYELSMPLVTLLTLALAYWVLQRPLAAVWDETTSSIYNWSFVLGTCACAVWLSMAVFGHTEALGRLLHQRRGAGESTVGTGGSLAAPKEERWGPGPG